MTKTEVVKALMKNGFGFVDAVKVYKKLTCNGFYEISRKELMKYIKENGY